MPDNTNDHDRIVEMHEQIKQIKADTACLQTVCKSLGQLEERVGWHWTHIKALWGGVSAVALLALTALVKYLTQ
jgi:hypothetical protein